jgi:EXS family
VSIGGIAEAQDGKFGDILLADVLTSYAKVLGDFFVSCCMFFARKASSTGKPDRSCGGTFIVPLIICIPFAIRFRQCLIEYGRVRRSMRSSSGPASSGWGGAHLANALKYATAFPVTILSAMQRGYDPATFGMSESGLFHLWWVTTRVSTFGTRLTASQGLLRLRQLFLFVLLGRSKGLGFDAILGLHRAE